MQHVKGEDRNQVIIFSLESAIAPDAFVRVTDVSEANNQRVKNNPGYYRQRQQITGQIFGTLKRQRGFTCTLVKGKEMLPGEVGLMFIGYNLTRCANIIGTKTLIKLLKECYLRIFRLKNSLF